MLNIWKKSRAMHVISNPTYKEAAVLLDSLKKLLLSCPVLTEWCCVKSQELSGTVGGQVTMRCPYPPQHSNYRKYLCKGDHRKRCRDMTSQSRFTTQDHLSSGFFSVTIKALKTSDAGTYLCVSDPLWRPANYTKIQLSVGKIIKKRHWWRTQLNIWRWSWM